MAKAVLVTKFTPLERVFKEIANDIDKIGNDEDLKKNASLDVAQKVAESIQQKYTVYADSVDNFEGGRNNVTIRVEDTGSNGYDVRIYGKNVLYQEYGTGTRGLKNPHPRHNADGMKPYGSGRNIIHNGIKNLNFTPTHDGGSRFGTEYEHNLPKWYILYRDFPRSNIKTDFGTEPIRSSDYVWRHNGIVTKGLPAGKFIYEGCEKYREDVAGKRLLKRTMVLSIKKKMKEIKKPEFKGDIKKYMIELKVYQARTKQNGGK